MNYLLCDNLTKLLGRRRVLRGGVKKDTMPGLYFNCGIWCHRIYTPGSAEKEQEEPQKGIEGFSTVFVLH